MLLRAGFITSIPMTYPIVFGDKTINRGNLIDFTRILKVKTNISTDIVYPSPSGWTGLIKMLIENKSEMSLTPIVLTEEALKLKFSKSIFFSSYIILSQFPEGRDQTDLIHQYSTIDPYFWVSFVICFSILSFISFVDKFTFETIRQINWWTIFRILVNQSCFRRAQLNSITALVSLYILCYTLICISINSLINVSLVVDSKQHFINSLEDILSAGTVLPAIYKSTKLEDLLSESNETIHRKIWSLISSRPELCLKVIPSPLTAHSPGFDPDYYRALVEGRVASFETDFSQMFVRNVYCRKVPTMRWHSSPPQNLIPLRYLFGFSKRVDDNVIKTINDLIERLLSSGFFLKWFHDDREAVKLISFMGEKSDECVNTPRRITSFVPINLSSFKTLVIINLNILSMSFIIIVCEFVFTKLSRYKIEVIKIH